MRREFSAKVKVAAYERSGGKCEACGLPLTVGKFAYDHVLPDAMGGSPTIENCAVICNGCHGRKTRDDVGRIAKTTRIKQKHIGARPRRAWPGTEKFKKRLDGTVVRREP